VGDRALKDIAEYILAGVLHCPNHQVERRFQDVDAPATWFAIGVSFLNRFVVFIFHGLPGKGTTSNGEKIAKHPASTVPRIASGFVE
ncbi:hypothetical protein, partial [Rhodopirellula bahusiensis]|uniref:hypothetical protein n=1 Tax=Rhodopirellula bahusiensis TaxID=2014065 RepID=UPI0032634E0A